MRPIMKKCISPISIIEAEDNTKYKSRCRNEREHHVCSYCIRVRQQLRVVPTRLVSMHPAWVFYMNVKSQIDLTYIRVYAKFSRGESDKVWLSSILQWLIFCLINWSCFGVKHGLGTPADSLRVIGTEDNLRKHTQHKLIMSELKIHREVTKSISSKWYAIVDKSH